MRNQIQEVTDRIIKQLQSKNSWGKNEAIEMVQSVRVGYAFELLNEIQEQQDKLKQ